jgi:hypothetical protein
MALRPTRPSEGVVACGKKDGPMQRTRPDPRDDSNKSLIFKFIGFFGIWQDFEKFYKASQGFLENTTCHAMIATLGQIKLRKSFPLS